MAEVVAVADPAEQARLVASLSAAFSAAGLHLVKRTHRELVAEVSIEQPMGQRPVVDPDRPLLWLSPGVTDRPATAEGRFLASETLAAARSIATLTRSPVLNRPSAVSPCGTLPSGRAVAVRRACRIHGLKAVIRAERFTGTWLPDDDSSSGRLEVYDYATGRSSYGLTSSSTGPFRRRTADEHADLLKIRVVGDRAITRADVPPATLAASLRIAFWYQLDLATLWWLIGKDDGASTLARVDCWAWDAGFDANFDEVAEAVMAWMSDRVGRPTGVRR
jgi:hypothetical protein